MGGDSNHSFQLLDEPWIPIEWLDGRFSEVGLLGAFADADKIRRIVDPSPLVTIALCRLLFAVFHRAAPIRGTNEWIEEWDRGDAHQRVGAYLEQWRHRFDLFDSEAPFWQVPDLPFEVGNMSWAKLAAELNDNNNRVLFDHTTTRRNLPAARPALVARLMVTCQMLSVGAGNSPLGYNLNAAVATSLIVIPEAGNLADTLISNARYGGQPDDMPVWEQAVPKAADIEAANNTKPATTFAWNGVASRLAWLTRAIHIEPPGDDGTVRRLAFAAGRRVEVAEGDRDPWVAYRVSNEGKWVPQRLDPRKSVWRDLHAIALRTDDSKAEQAKVLRELGSLEGNQRLFPAVWTLLVGGQAADKAKLEGWGQERWRLPDVVLRNRQFGSSVVRSSMEAGSVEDALWKITARLANDLLTESRERKVASEDRQKVLRSLPTLSTYWSRLEPAFTQFLSGLALQGPEPNAVVERAESGWNLALANAVAASSVATKSAIGRDAAAIRAWARSGPAYDRLASKYRHRAARLEG